MRGIASEKQLGTLCRPRRGALRPDERDRRLPRRRARLGGSPQPRAAAPAPPVASPARGSGHRRGRRAGGVGPALADKRQSGPSPTWTATADLGDRGTGTRRATVPSAASTQAFRPRPSPAVGTARSRVGTALRTSSAGGSGRPGVTTSTSSSGTTAATPATTSCAATSPTSSCARHLLRAERNAA